MVNEKDEEIKSKLGEILTPLVEDIRRIMSLYGISFSEACSLLRTYHMNNIHGMIVLWFKAQNFSDRP